MGGYPTHHGVYPPGRHIYTSTTLGIPPYPPYSSHARRYPVVRAVAGDDALGSNLGISLGERPRDLPSLPFLLTLVCRARVEHSGSRRRKNG